MTKVIQIEIKNKIAKRVKYNDNIVCDNTDYEIEFIFDEEWESNHAKTAIFTYNGKSEKVVFAGNICVAPKLYDTTSVSVGVFAGDLRTSTPATIPCKKSALSDEGLPPDPSPDVYAQILEKIDSGALKGEDGKDGANGITTPLNGFFTLQVDEEGNLYAYSNADGTTPEFEYDTETGDLFIVIETD